MPGLRLWRSISIALGLLSLAALITSFVFLPNMLSDNRGMLGYVSSAVRVGNESAARIEQIDPKSPLLAAGVAAGEVILAPQRGRLAVGQTVRLRVMNGSAVRVVEVQAMPAGEAVQPQALTVCETVLSILAFLLGALLVIRRWRDVTALAYGSAFFAGSTAVAALMPPAGALAAITETWQAGALTIFLFLFALGALSMASSSSRFGRWIIRAIAVLAALQLVVMLVLGAWLLGVGVPGPRFWLGIAGQLVQWPALVLCILATAHSWRQVQAEQRERMRWLFVGLALVLLAAILYLAYVAGLFGYDRSALVRVSIAADFFSALALVTMAYAILRHRVLDLGFAISRALVYAILTGLMLVAFGAVEWVADQLLEFEQRKQNAWLDGVLAVAIFLLFHPLQHWIAKTVERVFFSAWREKEAALERFLELSAHFTEPDALTKALLEAIDAYANATGSALYAPDAEQNQQLRMATLPDAAPVFESNDMQVVTLKSVLGQPVEGRDGGWAFPIARRGELIAFVAVSPKRSRDVYRPDEIAHIARVVRQVGFDLYALRLEKAVHHRI